MNDLIWIIVFAFKVSSLAACIAISYSLIYGIKSSNIRNNIFSRQLLSIILLFAVSLLAVIIWK
jgi:hypothetical protein